MATAREFIASVSQIDGVAGCVLLREDGQTLGFSLEDPDLYSSLMLMAGKIAQNIMDKVGFSSCRYLGFSRAGKEHFYLFTIDHFYLGIVQTPDCYVPDMLQAVLRLLGRVTTGTSQVQVESP